MMGMGFELRLECGLVCAMCGQYRHEDRVKETIVEAALFGHVFYAMCWSCKMDVPRKLHTASYRRKWLAVLAERATGSKDERIQWELARLLKTGGGYKPNKRAVYKREPFEFISYPYVEQERVVVLVREVEKPWTLEKHVPVERVVPLDRHVTATLHGLLPLSKVS